MPAGPTYENIATVTLGTLTPSISFTSIPASWTDLRLVFAGKGTNTSFRLGFNSDTGTNYSYVQLNGTGAAVTSAGATGQAPIAIANLDDTIPNLITIDILSYAGTRFKTSLIVRGSIAN